MKRKNLRYGHSAAVHEALITENIYIYVISNSELVDRSQNIEGRY